VDHAEAVSGLSTAWIKTRLVGLLSVQGIIISPFVGM
jgi:hypothetical protein